jgi:hypothetical protein
MSVALDHECANVYRVEISGVLRKADLERCEERLAAEMDRIGPVRLLFVLTEFEGWESHTDWNDLSFYATRGGAIERIAIVGPQRWRTEALMFAGADLRRAPVAFFPTGAAADARVWLSA